MEAAVTPAAGRGTGSRTMADIVKLAGERHGDKPALRHKVGEEWKDVSYSELAQTVKEVALGLVDIGIQPGEPVSILSNTRPEWTYADFGILAAGGSQVSIYQTNSPEECHYVLEHSESKAVFVEDQDQLAKVRQVQDKLPNLEHIVIFDADGDIGDAIPFAELRKRGSARDDSDYEERLAGVKDDDVCVYIYTSGTTGPPKGCILTHSNYRQVCSMTESMGVLEEDEVSYLFLPLAHAFALLIQFVTIDLGSTLAHTETDAQTILPPPLPPQPTYRPSFHPMF
jgi:long-chain acyl-CoA synthetase